ncbi:sialate O-acetylesterase [Flectobacillus rivi]|uniref:Sialate O-acetylesterase n=1 Tax=Flectobacillus rivi TaxID=2984209 RepID=A0ABT6YX78_9BACT|nr:sialate O-acetylesterase [Flectobacillus rivi]MDI9873486.1 sialate O-acetylesterase [Flectobacillus rivi]
MKTSRLWIFLLLLSFPCYVWGQMTILHPINRLILQRNLSNQADLAITGYTNAAATKIEYQLVEIGKPAKGWQTLASNVLNREFSGKVKVNAGFYDLYVRAWVNNTIIDEKIIEQIGVGEVFLIAGQSNAMGVQGLGSKDASEKVIVINDLDKYLDEKDNLTIAPNEPMRLHKMERALANTNMYPSGESAWLWGELADKIVQKYQVPVFLLNCGWAAATSENWSKSANGELAYNQYVSKYWPNQQPYANLKNTLQYLASHTGLRAVLWMQGESDAAHNQTSAQNYEANVKNLIEKSRQVFGYNMPWSIARSTVSSRNEWADLVIKGQNAILKNVPNTFAGPETDTIQNPRPIAHGHLENVKNGIQGLTLAATAWMRTMDTTFFKKAIPYQPQTTLVPRLLPTHLPFGRNFAVYFQGVTSQNKTYRVELLDKDGKFVAQVGQGTNSPVTINIQNVSPLEVYRLRIVSEAPFLQSTLSNTFTLSGSWTPLNLFTLVEKSDSLHLSWSYVEAYSPTKITVQYSTNQQNFTDVYTENANSTLEGKWAVIRPKEVFAYYRLKLTLADGSVVYTDTKLVIDYSQVLGIENPSVSVKIFPNPASTYLTIQGVNDMRQLQIFSSNGQEIMDIKSNRVGEEYWVEFPETIQNGAYFLRLQLPNNQIIFSKVLIMK